MFIHYIDMNTSLNRKRNKTETNVERLLTSDSAHNDYQLQKWK